MKAQNATNTTKLSTEDCFEFRMMKLDEAKVLANDLAFLRTHKQVCNSVADKCKSEHYTTLFHQQSNMLNEQLHELYVGLQVNVCYNPFSLMDSMQSVSTAAAATTSNATGDDAELVLAFDEARLLISVNSMMFEDDADMPISDHMQLS